ncbi:MAG: hypothetical protein NZM12_10285, partial [Steroidobacteraceae bacterium]|nr:hypothetical protein [Steroidobacteraceae bacterium]
MNITVFEQRPAPGENKFVPPARWVIVEATSYQWALLALRYVIAPHSHDRFVPWPSVGAWDEVDWDAFRETEDEAAYLSAHRISRYWV